MTMIGANTSRDHSVVIGTIRPIVSSVVLGVLSVGIQGSITISANRAYVRCAIVQAGEIKNE